MSERTFRIQSENGVKAAFRHAFNLALELVKAGGIEVVLRPLKSKRSIDQNRRYWAMLREIASVVWVDGRRYSDEVWHEQFKRWFIGIEEVQMPNGDIEQRGISTTKLSVDDFGKYMLQIEQWAAEQGYPVMLEAA